MNRTLFVIFSLFATLSFGANKPEVFGTVRGTVLDKQLQQPIPYASIAVLDPDGKIISGTVTGEDGEFILEKVPSGSYTFQVQFMGYQTYSENVIISEQKSEFDMGNIFLEPLVDQLEDVTVVAERSTIEQRIDRKVVNVGKDLTTMGATAADIMNNIPSVSMDQDGNLALRGNQNVKVLLDGKPTNMDVATLLKTIPSTSIKQIELITNPSAKYDPEGMSGIINIILHKNSNLGFNGSFSGGLTADKNLRSNASLNMNYRKGKFNFYTNLGANGGENSIEGQIIDLNSGVGEYPDLILGRTGYLTKLGVDFYMDQRNTFSLFTSQNFFKEYGRGHFDVLYPSDPTLSYVQGLDTDEKNVSSTYNFVYLHDFENEGHTIQLEVDHNEYTNDEDSFFGFTGGGNAPDSFEEFINRAHRTTLVNLDYVNPFSETFKLELGAEARLRTSENRFRSTSAGLSNTFYIYDRNIYSFYATFGQKLGKWGYQIGTRLENYFVEAEQEGENIYENDYFTAYPSAYLTYEATEKDAFQISYSRRVDRPSLNQVNPVRQLSTPRLTVRGNPELRPQFTNSMEFNYTRKMRKTTLSGSIFYRLVNDNISQIVQSDPENPQHIILTFDNVGDTHSYGLETSGSFEPFHFWTLNTDFNIYGQTLQGYLGTTYVEEENTYYRFQANNSFKLSQQWRLQLFGMYQSPMKTLQFNIEDMYFVNFGGRYSFWEDKASLSLNINDIFNTRVQEFRTEQPTPQYGRLKFNSRSVHLGFSYRFGGGKNKALQRKQRDENTAEGGMF